MCKIISPQVFDRSRARAGGSAAAPLLVLSPCFTDLGNLGRSTFAQAKHLSPFELAAVPFCSRPDRFSTEPAGFINRIYGIFSPPQICVGKPKIHLLPVNQLEAVCRQQIVWRREPACRQRSHEIADCARKFSGLKIFAGNFQKRCFVALKNLSKMGRTLYDLYRAQINPECRFLSATT